MRFIYLFIYILPLIFHEFYIIIYFNLVLLCKQFRYFVFLILFYLFCDILFVITTGISFICFYCGIDTIRSYCGIDTIRSSGLHSFLKS
jgi:hypothetical protein